MKLDEDLVRQACAIAARSRQQGNHPFGALLVGPDGRVLAEAENTVVTTGDVTGHAETNLVRRVTPVHDEAFLARCSLVTSTEPCAMCAGAIYWSGIGRVVYGLSEAGLARLTGADAENPTMHLAAREVFAHGQRAIDVVGPIELPETTAVHEGFWDPERTERGG